MTPGLLFGSAAVLIGGALSARWNWWRLRRPGVPILMYHKVGNPPEGSQLKKLWVSTARFEQQMEYLAEEGYTPIVFQDVYRHWDKGEPLPKNPILITFDDGYANNFTDAFPITEKFGFPATLFIVTNTVGGDNKWHDPKTETRIPMASWEQIKELKRAGWEIGSHTLNHRNLLRLNPDEVRTEVTDSRRVLAEKLGENPPTFAYPYGAGADEDAVRAAVKDAGYRVAVSVHAGKWTPDQFLARPFELPRVFVRGDEQMLDFRLQLTRGRSRL